MLGLIVIIFLSWTLFFLFEKRNLSALGTFPLPQRFKEFIIGLVSVTVIISVIILLDILIKGLELELKSEISFQQLLDSFYYHLRSALTEELIFRGAILYIICQRIGLKSGILLSSLAFGIYHLFSFQMLDTSLIQQSYIILITGFMGYSWAYSYAKTGSILLGFGFHFGWNYLQSLYLPLKPYGTIVFESSFFFKSWSNQWAEFGFEIFRGLLPGIMLLIFLYYYTRDKESFTEHY